MKTRFDLYFKLVCLPLAPKINFDCLSCGFTDKYYARSEGNRSDKHISLLHCGITYGYEKVHVTGLRNHIHNTSFFFVNYQLAQKVSVFVYVEPLQPSII
jgi:hypothetical protein